MSGRVPSTQRSPWVFFALVLAIAVPFWASGALVEQGLLSGLGVGLPVSALAFVPDLQGNQTLVWIVGQRGFSVAFRVLLVWLYSSTGQSVFAAALLHAMDNVSVFTLFPNDDGSPYNPSVTAVITALVATVVTAVWRPSRPRSEIA